MILEPRCGRRVLSSRDAVLMTLSARAYRRRNHYVSNRFERVLWLRAHDTRRRFKLDDVSTTYDERGSIPGRLEDSSSPAFFLGWRASRFSIKRFLFFIHDTQTNGRIVDIVLIKTSKGYGFSLFSGSNSVLDGSWMLYGTHRFHTDFAISYQSIVEYR